MATKHRRSRWSMLHTVLALSVGMVVALGLLAKSTAAQTTLSDILGPRSVEPAEQPVVLAPMTNTEQVLATSLALDSTVRVSARTCSGSLIGSGFVIEGLIVTNQHLVQGASAVKVELGQDRAVLPVIHVSQDVDMAIIDAGFLAGASDSLSSLQWAALNPPTGEAVVLAGHAGGGETKLIVSEVHTYASGGPYGVGGEVMLIDAPTEGGFSGGPVLNRKGEVVGMLQGFDRSTNLTLVIPVEILSSQSTGISALGLDEPSNIDLNPDLRSPECE